MDNIIVAKNILSPSLVNELRSLLRVEVCFVQAGVIGDQSWRSGKVSYIEYTSIGANVAEGIKQFMLRTDSELLDFAPKKIEVMLTSYGDGDYFREHADDSSPEVASRKVSWVTYLNAYPGENRWTGGELIIKDAANTTTFSPTDGETIFFASSLLHEVATVSAPPGWENRRFSVNGWIS